MNLKKLLELGYFPKELPPPFETKKFAEKSRWIKEKWEKHLIQEKQPKPGETSQKIANKRFYPAYKKYDSSQLTNFSIAKGSYTRRKLSFPNPLQMMNLSVKVVENWEYLRDSCLVSNYSQSYPVEHKAKRTLRTKSKSWNEFKFEIIEKSFDKKFELRLDISKFYPSIYTHSIPWALLGKEKSKSLFKIKNLPNATWGNMVATNNSDALNYLLVDEIDTLVRNCNDRQSVGLPIGPDTSFLLAECIACSLDKEIENRLVNISHSGIRYYDDYYFYVSNVSEAEFILKTVLQVFNDFQLESNESKAQISTIPFKYIDEWAVKISMFKFSAIDKYEIRDFFTLLFEIISANKEHSSWIISYALGRFEYGRVKISRKNWDFFLNFLLKTILLDSSTLSQVFKIILSYEKYLNSKGKEKIGNVLSTVIKDNVELNHSFEVSWSLWVFKSLEIKIEVSLLRQILKSGDVTSILVSLDIINSKLYFGGTPGVSHLNNSLTGLNLFESNWLLVYEAYVKKWLNFKNKNVLDSNTFLKFCNEYEVEFYNSKNQIKPHFKIGEPSTPRNDDKDLDKGPYGYLEDLEGSDLFDFLMTKDD